MIYSHLTGYSYYRLLRFTWLIRKRRLVFLSIKNAHIHSFPFATNKGDIVTEMFQVEQLRSLALLRLLTWLWRNRDSALDAPLTWRGVSSLQVLDSLPRMILFLLNTTENAIFFFVSTLCASVSNRFGQSCCLTLSRLRRLKTIYLKFVTYMQRKCWIFFFKFFEIFYISHLIFWIRLHTVSATYSRH